MLLNAPEVVPIERPELAREAAEVTVEQKFENGGEVGADG